MTKNKAKNMATSKNTKPVRKMDRFLREIITTSRNYEVYSMTYEKSIDGLPRKGAEKSEWD